MKFIFYNSKLSKKGFTLIELLIVIAILGVLATLVIALINPVEALARSRDSGRKATVKSLSTAMQGYYSTRSSNSTLSAWPTASATWITSLQTAGELKTIPPTTTYGANNVIACATTATTFNQNSYCYYASGTTASSDVVIFARLESTAENQKCSAATPNAYFLWSSKDNQMGVVCLSADPTVYTFGTYLQ